MRRENRVRIQCDAVFPPFAPLEFNMALLRRAVLRAKETRPFTKGLWIQGRLRGNFPTRVVLDNDLQTANSQPFGLHLLEVTIVLGG